ncbi:MAG: amino acid ABC transporter permease [Candidatus Izemoplasmataceae bacterium]
MNDLFQFSKINEWIPYLVKGLGITLLIALVAAIFGFIIGIIFVLMGKHKRLKYLSVVTVDILRGTPIILQLSLVYFAVPQIINRVLSEGLNLDYRVQIAGLTAAFITFSINSGAYISEIIRGGINSVDKGEIEAAKALGISRVYIFKDIVLPIAFRNGLPSLINEFITLIKESSIVSLIGIHDLMRRQQIVTSQTYMYFEPLIIIGIIYYTVIKLIAIIGRKVEVKLAYGRS